MDESILNTIKKLLGLDPDFPAFDDDLVIHINSVFFVMHQMGIGKQFRIEGPDELWADYLDDRLDLEAVRTYMYGKVRQVFDPPTTGALKEALDAMVKEYEWRLFSATDLTDTKPEDIVPYGTRRNRDV